MITFATGFAEPGEEIVGADDNTEASSMVQATGGVKPHYDKPDPNAQ